MVATPCAILAKIRNKLTKQNKKENNSFGLFYSQKKKKKEKTNVRLLGYNPDYQPDWGCFLNSLNIKKKSKLHFIC